MSTERTVADPEQPPVHLWSIELKDKDITLLITESNPTRLWINALDKNDNPVVYSMAVR